ncbi:hypothetical protein SUDANB105_05203 [Streptomyces sp. enrichment culture]
MGYLASPAAARINGQVLVVHGGMVAVVERPRVREKFDSEQDSFTHEELDALLTPHFAARPTGETFAAAEVLGLRRGSRRPPGRASRRTRQGPAHREVDGARCRAE